MNVNFTDKLCGSCAGPSQDDEHTIRGEEMPDRETEDRRQGNGGHVTAARGHVAVWCAGTLRRQGVY